MVSFPVSEIVVACVGSQLTERRDRTGIAWAPGPQGSLKDLKALSQKLHSLSFARAVYSPEFHGKGLTTPTREAMRRSSAFNNWIELLRGLGVDLTEFAAAEAPLLDDGWTAHTLLRLMTVRYTSPDNHDSIKCKHCGSQPPNLQCYWEPLWAIHLERMKYGTIAGSSVNVSDSETRQKWRRYVELYVVHRVCFYCQVKFQEEASGDIESVPGLIEVDL